MALRKKHVIDDIVAHAHGKIDKERLVVLKSYEFVRYFLRHDDPSNRESVIKYLKEEDKDDIASRMQANQMSDEFLARFQTANGSYICNNMLGCDLMT